MNWNDKFDQEYKSSAKDSESILEKQKNKNKKQNEYIKMS